MTLIDGFGWLASYLSQLFPTRIRATGQGFFWNDLLLAVATAHSASRHDLPSNRWAIVRRCAALLCVNASRDQPALSLPFHRVLADGRPGDDLDKPAVPIARPGLPLLLCPLSRHSDSPTWSMS
jgi:hypothetical protein